MKQLIYLLGTIWSYLYPQLIRNKLESIRVRFFAGYKARKFKAFGQTSTIGIHSVYIREQYITIGENTHIGDYGRLTAYDYYQHTHQQFTPQITIGNNCSIGYQSHITAINSIVIGNNVLMGPRVLITDNAHGESTLEALQIPPSKRNLHSNGDVHIGDNVWIGEGAMIMPNVQIGKGAIIACNSVVTTDIPAYTIAAGSPAKIIKSFKPTH